MPPPPPPPPPPPAAEAAKAEGNRMFGLGKYHAAAEVRRCAREAWHTRVTLIQRRTTHNAQRTTRDTR
jgi:hypothetical protein